MLLIEYIPSIRCRLSTYRFLSRLFFRRWNLEPRFYFDPNSIDGPMQLLPFFRRDRTAARKPEFSICYTVPLSRETIMLYTRVHHNATCIPRLYLR